MKKILTSLFLIVFIFMGSANNQAIRQSQVENEITDLAVKFITDLSRRDFDKAVTEYVYSSEMQEIISKSFLRDQFWDFFTTSYGDYQKITGVETSELQGYDIISVNTSFVQAKIKMNIVFDQNQRIAGLNHAFIEHNIRRELPKNIRESEIEFGKKDWKLPGTLTIPTEVENPPVVVLVHGSGPNDRDETIGPNKPFRDIAWGLAERGIASLRYDKRTFAHSKKIINQLSSFTVDDETIEDALFAAQYLKTLDYLNSDAIFVIGHSLGGMLIPRIAEKSPDARGYIIISAPVIPLEDLMIEQIKYIAEFDGIVTPDEKNRLIAAEKMRKNVKKLNHHSTTPIIDLFDIPAQYWLDLRGYNPAELAKKIEKPLLILQGERDYQITMKEFQLWQDILGPRENVSYISYPNLNHILLAGEGKSHPQEYNLDGQVDKQLILDLASWIKNNL